MTRRKAVGGVLTTVLLALGLATPARAATHDVTISDNAFNPDVVEIQPGDSVRWTATRPGHTVTATDGQFNFHPARTLDAGEQVTATFPDEGFVKYFCRMHAGMEGLIQVGDPPVEPVPPGPSLVVPDQVPTIAAATAAAAPGTEILVRPGIYREEVVVDTAGLVVRGLGDDVDDVVLQGDNRRDVGVRLAAPDLRLENVTVTGYRRAGVVADAASGTVVQGVALHANGLYGIDGDAPAGLTVRDVDISGHGVAGIGVRDCETCGLRIDDARLEANAAGVVGVAATGVIVRDSVIGGNAVGIVLRDVDGAQVVGNTLTDNDARDVWVASVFDDSEPPTGAGIWIRGGNDNQVDGNTVEGHSYNVVVTGPEPALGHRISDNTVSGAKHADLGWDGIGAGVCFAGNRAPNGGGPTSDPPAVESVYDCARPTTIGLPYPVIVAHLLNHARSVGYPV